MRELDLVVIGTGTAAGAVAHRCRGAGWSVAVVDERPYGGTCALRGCDPKKMLRRGAEIVDAARLMEGAGIVPDGLRVDWPALQGHKRSFTDPVPEKRERGFDEKGVLTLHGTARFVDRNTVAVGEERLRARHVVIATGMRPRPLGIPGEELVATSDAFLELERLPARVLFIGGGYVSFEFAHIAARAGAEVTVLTRGERPLTNFDPDLVYMLVERSRRVGIDLQANAEVEAVEAADGRRRVRASVDRVARDFGADLVVHGAGRVPALDGMALEVGEVRVGRRGGVEVDEHLRSPSNPAVYAAGDAADTAGPPLTPVASIEGKVVAANLLHGDHAKPDYAGVPSALFTVPALARVGLLEAEAEAQGLDVEAKFSDMRGWFTTRRVRETHAAAKVLTEKGTGRIVGAHLLGPESAEIINLFALAIQGGLRAEQLRRFTSAYPSAGSDLSYLV